MTSANICSQWRPAGRFALAAAALNDRIFAIGGLAKWPGHGSAVEACPRARCQRDKRLLERKKTTKKRKKHVKNLRQI